MATLVTKPETWEAGNRIDDLLDSVAPGRPQIITREGIERAVVIPIAEWRESHPESGERSSLLEHILSGPTFEIPDESENRGKCRPPIEF